MPDKKPGFNWKSQKVAKDCKEVECQPYDTYKDFKLDPTGYYVLIRPNFDTHRLELALCNRTHEIKQVFSGHCQQDICLAMIDQEKKQQTSWISDPMHWAYIGRELKKAEIALAMGNSAYFQE